MSGQIKMKQQSFFLMLNSDAWVKKYTPILKKQNTSNNLNSPQRSGSLVTNDISLLPSATGSSPAFLGTDANSDFDSDFDSMEDWIDIGEEFDWDFSEDSDDSNTGFEGAPVYDNLRTIPEEPKDQKNGCFSSKKDFNDKSKKFVRKFKQKAPYYVPVVNWLPKYQVTQWGLADFLAGIAISAVVIPQGIAYSSLANVPPVYGLYTAWLPCVIYFLMGTSRQLSIGPEGVISLLAGAALVLGYQDVEGGETLYEYTVPRAAVLTFLVGLFTLILGILRVGFLDNLISRPILHGFVSASAAIIFVEQLDTFLGFHVSEQEWEKIIGVSENLDQINWYSTGIGCVCLILIISIDLIKVKFSKAFPPLKYVPTPLLIVGGTTLVVWLAEFENKGVIVLGEVDGGFPVPTIPRFWDLKIVESVIVEAVLISIVGFVESNAIAKTYALEHSYEVSANRELVALGTANLVSSCFGSYPAFGSLARSKIANAAGARTQLFGLVASCVVLVTMIFLMPVFYYLPKSAIAAIIMVAAARLIEFHIDFLWKIRAFKEIGLTIFTFLTTFFLGPELGIVMAIGISIFLVIKHTTLPSVEVLGRTKNGKWRDVSVMTNHVEMFPGILVIRIDESLYFGNIEQLVKMVNRIVNLGSVHAHPTDMTTHQEKIHGLIIDARNIHSIDANALTVLKDLFEDYHKKGIEICFVHLRDKHIRNLYKGGLTKLITVEHFHLKLNSALLFLQEKRNSIATTKISGQEDHV